MTEERSFRVLVPQTLIAHPHLVWQMLDQIVGANVREKAHQLWHETQDDDTLHPTGITVRYAQIQALLDYADEVDACNHRTTELLLEHFGWKFPTNENEDHDALD